MSRENHHDNCPVCEARASITISQKAAKESSTYKYGYLTAQLINELRLLPRVLVALYGYICWLTFEWFTGLGTEATTQQLAFASTIWGAAAVWFTFFVNSERE